MQQEQVQCSDQTRIHTIEPIEQTLIILKKAVISVVKAARILFVCVENAGRSQMAEAFLRRHAPHICAASAGTVPRSTVNPVVADAMDEVGIDIKGNTPKRLTQDMIDGDKHGMRGP